MRFWFVVVMSALSACGSTEGFQIVTWERAVSAQNQLARLDELELTTESNMPTTGSASFTGSAIIGIDRGDFSASGDLGIVGDATLDVDFSGSGTVTGRIDNYEAVNNAGTDLQTLVPASGHIDIGLDDSFVGVAGLNNAWAADYQGNINVDGTNYIVDDVLVGVFIGNRTSDPTPERITKGILGTNATLPTQYAIPDGGLPAQVEIGVFGEN